jgi:hypothetical protein
MGLWRDRRRRINPYLSLCHVSGYIAITLAWDRGIFKAGGLDDTYDPSNMFVGEIVDNLNLFLAPVGWENLLQDSVAMSTATDDSVEHIFANVDPGNYEIVVTHDDSGDDRDFGLA